MRILIVTQYFWPEEFRVNDLVAHLVSKGDEVTVLTGLPNYPEGHLHAGYQADPARYAAYGGARVCRVPHVLRGSGRLSLALNYLSFFVSASLLGAWRLRGQRFDVIFVFAVSPITSAIPAIVLRWLKKAPLFLWVQDLWPEALADVGVVRSPRLLHAVGKLVSWIYRRCDTILIQSRAFADSVMQYCSDACARKIVYFPNWAEGVFGESADAPASPAQERRPFTILFAGNIGESQDFPAILDAVELLKDRADICWKIVGDGRKREWMQAEVERRGIGQRIAWLGRHPVEAMPGFFAEADALLVVLKAGKIYSRTVPSKVQSYLAAGKPMLGMINGEARRVLDESGAALTCPAGDAAGLAELADRMAALGAGELAAMGRRGRDFYSVNFDRVALFGRLREMFQAAAGAARGM